MNKHRYCCQNTAQNYLDHIIPVPDDFDVNPACLNGLCRGEFISGLKELTGIIKNMYADIIKNPAEYGFPLIDDIVYSPANPKAADSIYAPGRLIVILYMLVNSGELSDEGILINKEVFSEMLKAKRPVFFKISNYKVILKKLSDFGLLFDGSVLSYPDNNDVIKALYGYMKNVGLDRDSLMAMNYYLVMNPQSKPNDIKQKIFAEYLSGAEREFYVWLNGIYMEAGFHCVNVGYHFMLDYHLNQNEKKRALRCKAQNGKLEIFCKLYHVGDYSELIEKAPERIKEVFCDIKTCSAENCLYKRDSCICRVDYTIGGKEYRACTFERFFRFDNIGTEDLEFFKRVFSIEVKKQQGKSK